jgi:hypothetical protein
MKRLLKYKLFEAKAKPEPTAEKNNIRRRKLDYHDMMEYLEEKYNFNARGFSGIPSTIDLDRHFDKWCDKHGLPQKDSEGKHRSSSQEFYTQYKEAEDGEKAKPPYMDFWHYLCEYNDDNVRNGGYIHIPRTVDTSKDPSPERNLDMYRKLKAMYPKDKEINKNLDIVIAREEEALKNPKVDPWKGWKQQITDLIFEEFGEYATGDSLRVWVEW